MTAAKRPKPKAEEESERTSRRARMTPQFLAAREKWNAEQKAKAEARKQERAPREEQRQEEAEMNSERAREIHNRIMGRLNRTGPPKGSPSSTCHCGRPALYIIRRYKQPDEFVCVLHKEKDSK